jgi:hypothetical protein
MVRKVGFANRTIRGLAHVRLQKLVASERVSLFWTNA